MDRCAQRSIRRRTLSTHGKAVGAQGNGGADKAVGGGGDSNGGMVNPAAIVAAAQSAWYAGRLGRKEAKTKVLASVCLMA